jgi:hypothetical protein
MRNLLITRVWRGLFWLVLVIVGVAVFRNVQRAHAQDSIVSGSSVVLQEVVTKAGGTKVLSAMYTFATRGDGSSAFVGIHDPSSAEAPVRIIQLASGSQGMISDSKQQKYVTNLSAEANPALQQNVRNPSSLCLITLANYKESALGQEQVSGYRAEKISGAGNITSWYAVDYGCALVKQHAAWSGGGSTDKYLVMLRPGEPDSSLFTVPASYTDVPKTAFLNP